MEKTDLEKQGIVISYANQKGGVGKSTLTCMTANFLTAKGYKVLVIDSDFQGSVIALRELDKQMLGNDFKFPYDVIYCPATELEGVLDNEIDKFDVIMIDMPGQSYGEGLGKLLTFLDYAFIPVKTGDTDVYSTVDFVKDVITASGIRKECDIDELKYYIVINEAEVSTNRFKMLVEFIGKEGYNFNDSLVVKKKVSIKELSNTFVDPMKEKEGKDLIPFFLKIEELIGLKN